MKHFEIIIMGAGLAGLHLCSNLKNKETLILEKSRGVGGRFATRRINELSIDHGIQYITHPLNFLQVKHHTLNGFYSEEGMTNIAKKLSRDLRIEKNQKIIELTHSSLWTVKTDSGEVFTTKKIVLTAPLPQSLELLKNNDLLNNQAESYLSQVQYHKMVQAIFIIDSIPSNLKSFETQEFKITLMREKALHPQAMLLSLNSKLSEEKFEFSDDENLKFLNEKLSKQFSCELKINHLELKKWRYSTPVSALPESYYEFPNQLYLIGDSFIYPDIRGAALSAEALANHLNQELK